VYLQDGIVMPGPPAPTQTRRWWFESWRSDELRAVFVHVVSESQGWWEGTPHRSPAPPTPGSIGVSQPDGAAKWLDAIWELPVRSTRQQGRRKSRRK
jgi:hypothetical protein